MMLKSAAMPLLDNVHSEAVFILDGVDTGKVFYGILEHVPDIALESDIISDPRGKRMLRFTDRPGNVPSTNTSKMVKVKLGNKTYTATRQDFSAYLSVDFELVELPVGKG